MGKHTATVSIEIGGKNYQLKYDYAAMSALDAECTRDDLENLNNIPIAKLVKILHIGLMVHHPDVTENDIMKASPPVAAVAKAIDNALIYTRFGPETAEQIIAKMAELQEAAKNAATKPDPKGKGGDEAKSKKKTGSRKI